MDWITGIQRAINYMEDHITEKIDYEKVAQQAYVSNFYFQRVFAILCGYTVGEYIRNRRLSLAGTELLSTNEKIITIALKYGYETPESFTRAFTRFHEVTPTAARTDSVSLKSFARLSIKLSLEGGEIMNYKMKQLPAFQVAVKTKQVNSDSDLNKKEIPQFWDDCRKNGTLQKLCGYLNQSVFGNAIVGICEEDTCSSKTFPYSIGVAYNGKSVDEGFVVKEMPSHTWVVFECKGAMPKAIQELWHRIYTEFFPASEYQPCGGMDFEVYPDGDMNSSEYYCEIWIAVEKK